MERQQKLDDWKTKFETYYQSMVENPEGIYGIYKNITETKDRISTLDKNLTSAVSKESAEIQQTILKWQNQVDSTVSKAVSSAVSAATSAYRNNNSTYTVDKGNKVIPNDTKVDADASKYSKINDIPNPSFKKGQKVRTKESFGYVQTTSFSDKDLVSNGDGTYSASKTTGGGTSGLFVSKQKFTTGKQVYYKGQWYYQITDNSWLGGKTQYIKGLQIEKYAKGGLNTHSGPAWLDGTPQQPEAVLNALQTEHFIKFTNTLDKMFTKGVSNTNANSISIENISFNVESMSSPEDGEAAFNMFVNKFKEIGNQTGIKINSFKNTL